MAIADDFKAINARCKELSKHILGEPKADADETIDLSSMQRMGAGRKRGTLPCPRCDQTGHIPDPRAHVPPSICPSCNGTGHV